MGASRSCPRWPCPNLQPCILHPTGPYANARRSTALYHTPGWRSLRKAQLQAEPYCRYCGAKANTADHITPHQGNERAFWTGALQSLCTPCSRRKTGQEIGARR